MYNGQLNITIMYTVTNIKITWLLTLLFGTQIANFIIFDHLKAQTQLSVYGQYEII